VREVRFSEFQEATHSFTLSERSVAAKEFDNELRLMGPLVAASDGRETLLVAYEHGSQVPDAFLEYRLGAARTMTLSAVKGNYLDGQRLSAAHPWRSVWMHAAAHAGPIDAMAPLYRDFVLRWLSLAGESRKPYVFYNTWNFQERNKWWYHHPYLDSMNEQRILAEIDAAHAMGIDVFVLDTGWYEKTGDWQVSPARFPNGLAPIRARLESYGMKLGLWFNPTAAAVSSAMLARERGNVMSWHGREHKPEAVWETEPSHVMCLVSDYGDAFADKLIEVAKATGARYFKWDAIGQYGCDSPNHHHGAAANTPEERRDSYAFQLPAVMARIAERVSAEVPDAIVDFDITEGGRAVGLSFLSAGKYFLINNGPYKFNYDLPMDFQKDNWNLFFYPGPARTWICRTPLTYDKWIPAVLFLTHYYPDDPVESQAVNVASLILGQNGIWGDLPRVSTAGVNWIGEALRHYKQVRDDITAASPVRSGGVGGTPEIHEKIASNGRGAVVVFATVPGDFTYVTTARAARSEWHTGLTGVAWDAAGRARISVHLERPGAAIVLFGVAADGAAAGR
jgi:alpha-galactosidase